MIFSSICHFGNVNLRSKKEEFEAAVKELKKTHRGFQKELEAKLQKATTIIAWR
jgi:hypothetical protein